MQVEKLKIHRRGCIRSLTSEPVINKLLAFNFGCYMTGIGSKYVSYLTSYIFFIEGNIVDDLTPSQEISIFCSPVDNPSKVVGKVLHFMSFKYVIMLNNNFHVLIPEGNMKT